jgi:hypothetical protein
MRIPFLLLSILLAVLGLQAAEHHGQVKFGGLPVPGATVTATQGDKKFVAVTDQQGDYSFPDLPDGTWTIQVEMLCFSTVKQDLASAPGAPGSDWELKLLPMDQIQATAVAAPTLPAATASPSNPSPATPDTKPAEKSRSAKAGGTPPPANTPGGFQRTDVTASGAPASGDTLPASDAFANQSASDLNQRAADGFLINGTANNGASSPFALAAAFGNNRRGPRSLYNGNIGMIVDNSVLDARSFSITGQDTPKPAYNHLTGVFSFGGPLRIPHLLKNGPNFVVNYQWTRNRNATTTPGLMPTALERGGDFSQSLNALGKPVELFDPSTGLPIPGNVIPPSQISSQARALLNLYPLPNFTSGAQYNYQIPIVGVTHQDSLQSRANKSIGRKNQISGVFAFQSTRTDSSNLFGFLDTTDTTGINSSVTWRHSFTNRVYGTLGYQFSRWSARTKPFFENRENVSGLAGITGNNQDALNWGPPSLQFSSGLTGLSDALQSLTRNETNAVSYDVLWNHSPHNISIGGDFKRLQFNLLSQQDPRGTFTFTGASTEASANGIPIPGTGSALAGLLLGIPDTLSVAFGNADKYFRASSYDAYITDDWRMSPGFTLNAGVRWEYGSPITELYGRLVNLDIAPGFANRAPVVAYDPIGPLTGQTYPASLVQPDKHAIQPRVAFSWRPFPASSMVVRGGYGVYYNTSVYQTIATQMAQQSPLSKSLSIQNSPSNPLTLANGLNAPGTSYTFAIDPNFRVGYSQNWQLSVQRDLPGALVMTATYLGIKGTRGMQEFLPNTSPDVGALNACPTGPCGYAYMTSNGNSTREAGTFQLRRRLHNGITGSVQYVYSKSIDDSALGGRGQATSVIAQNWLDLSGERGLSSFDQRHLVTLQGQYTTGMGIGGGTLVNGWRGALFKEWTFVTNITVGTGLPLTPVYFAAVGGTGVTGSIRPDYTGASLYAAPPGFFLNSAAYTAPAPGEWGNAGRDSITGPGQFIFNASIGRTFRIGDRFNVDLRVDSTNALNHVTYPNWNTTITSGQFGLPSMANPMRSMQTTLRFRF